jgi:creatinine amidohydrolase
VRTVRFELLRPGEIVQERARRPVVYQPIGPLEWHGPHMPFGVDPLHADAVAVRVAETAGGVVMPTLYWGTERERNPDTLRALGFQGDEYIVGMDFPPHSMKSLYTPEDVFGVVVRARLDLLVRQQYRLIVIVNGHGAQNHLISLARLAAEYSAESPAKVMLITAFEPDPNGYTSIGHADALETSLMMALYPETVDISKLPSLPEPLLNINYGIVDGATFDGHPNPERTPTPENDPRVTASADKGKAVFDSSIIWVANQVRTALADLGKK